MSLLIFISSLPSLGDKSKQYNAMRSENEFLLLIALTPMLKHDLAHPWHSSILDELNYNRSYIKYIFINNFQGTKNEVLNSKWIYN